MTSCSKVSSTWQIPGEMQGLRADRYLVRRIGRISRERARRIIDAGDFLLDGESVKPSMRVRGGQSATLIRLAPDKKADIDDFVFEKIFEDSDLLVVNKPAGISIHPSANCLYRTLTFWLRKHYLEQNINPCHRIDKETSGIVVCAKNREVEASIKKRFMRGQVKKTYLAIVEGQLRSRLNIDLPLALQQGRGLVAIRMVEDAMGKAAHTRIKPIFVDQARNRTLVLCHPITGRQHQIRAHLSLSGFPIVGDKLYGMGDEFFDQLSRGHDEILSKLSHHRHALHALKVSVVLSGKMLRFKCPIPKDFFELIGKQLPLCADTSEPVGTQSSKAFWPGICGGHGK